MTAAERNGPAVVAEGLSVWFGDTRVLREVGLVCPGGELTAIIGPTGAGKSTLLRTINRLAEEQPGFRRDGRLRVGGEDVGEVRDVAALRRRIGMIFDVPAPFPMSVLENVAFGLKVAGTTDAGVVAERVERALRRTGLWDELRGDLGRPAAAFPPGQQQRICIARTLALEPEVLLLDEPTGHLDPAATGQIEELLLGLHGACTVVLVTQDAQQAGRLADVTAFMERGTVIEWGPTDELFTRPRDPATEAWLTRRFAHR